MSTTRRPIAPPLGQSLPEIVSVKLEDPVVALTRDRIRDAILQGEFVPNQRLIEGELSERFDASRFVIRSALQNLVGQGLVEYQRNRGARVRDISLAEATQITEVRQLLESFTAERAAQNITAARAANLRRIAKEMRAAVKAEDLLRYDALTSELHRALREYSEHQVSSEMLVQLRDLMVRHHFTLSLIPGRSLVSLPQNEAIIAAVAAGDPEAAAAATRDHLQSVLDALKVLSANFRLR
jgi:DNA-binding GntR family transcriptional regulator